MWYFLEWSGSILLKQTNKRACDVLLEWMLERAHDDWKDVKWNPISSERLLHWFSTQGFARL